MVNMRDLRRRISHERKRRRQLEYEMGELKDAMVSSKQQWSLQTQVRWACCMLRAARRCFAAAAPWFCSCRCCR